MCPHLARADPPWPRAAGAHGAPRGEHLATRAVQLMHCLPAVEACISMCVGCCHCNPTLRCALTLLGQTPLGLPPRPRTALMRVDGFKLGAGPPKVMGMRHGMNKTCWKILHPFPGAAGAFHRSNGLLHYSYWGNGLLPHNGVTPTHE